MFAKWRKKFDRRRRVTPPQGNPEADPTALRREQMVFTACLFVVIVGIVLLLVLT